MGRFCVTITEKNHPVKSSCCVRGCAWRSQTCNKTPKITFTDVFADFQLNLHGLLFFFPNTETIKVSEEGHQHGLQDAEPHQGKDARAEVGCNKTLKK